MADEVSGHGLTETEKVYARLRAQIVDENELYNQRTHWLIFIEALLFATTGLVFEVFFTNEVGGHRTFIGAFILVIGLLGIYTALVCFRTLNNAGDALTEIRALWDGYVEATGASSKELLWFPHVAGGTPKGEDQKRGRQSLVFRSRFLPLGFVVAWVAILGLFFYFVFIVPSMSTP